jgi:hypothetical protein
MGTIHTSFEIEIKVHVLQHRFNIISTSLAHGDVLEAIECCLNGNADRYSY